MKTMLLTDYVGSHGIQNQRLVSTARVWLDAQISVMKILSLSGPETSKEVVGMIMTKSEYHPRLA